MTRALLGGDVARRINEAFPESAIRHNETDVWQGADLQEREIWDLMGIHFDGHPNMKRIMLWEGFPGHPLRKDSLV